MNSLNTSSEILLKWFLCAMYKLYFKPSNTLKAIVIMALSGFRSTPTNSLGEAEPCIKFIQPPEWPFEQTSVLVRAIRHEKLRHVKMLLKKGCNPNKPVGDAHMLPLMMAYYVKNRDKRLSIVKALLEFDVNPMLTDSEGRNCLMYACALSLLDEVECLVKKSCFNFKATDAHGNTILHYCALAGNVSVLSAILEKMLEYLLRINHRNDNNHTALDVAILSNNPACTQVLRNAGGQRTLPRYRVMCSLLPRLTEHVSTGGSSGGCGIDWRVNMTNATAAKYQRKEQMKRGLSLLSSKTDPPSSDDIVHRLLSLKGKRTTPTYCRPSKTMVPLDTEWVTRTRAAMNPCHKKPCRRKSIMPLYRIPSTSTESSPK